MSNKCDSKLGKGSQEYLLTGEVYSPKSEDLYQINKQHFDDYDENTFSFKLHVYPESTIQPYIPDLRTQTQSTDRKSLDEQHENQKENNFTIFSVEEIGFGRIQSYYYNPQIQIIQEQDKKEAQKIEDDQSLPTSNLEVAFSIILLCFQSFIPQRMIGTPQQQKKQKDNTRNDGHNISQNISSMLITSVTNQLAQEEAQLHSSSKSKKIIKEKVRNFLNDMIGLNGQMTMLFIYLFLQQEKAKQKVYQIMHRQIKDYLSKKQKQAQGKSHKQKQSLELKIRANRELSQILFKDKYDSPLDFDEIQSVGKDLFGGRQKRGLKKTLDKAKQIYRSLAGTVSSEGSETNSLQIPTQFRQQ